MHFPALRILLFVSATAFIFSISSCLKHEFDTPVLKEELEFPLAFGSTPMMAWADNSHGMLMAEGAVYLTADGGQTWILAESFPNVYNVDVAYPVPDTAYVMVRPTTQSISHIYRITDGGANTDYVGIFGSFGDVEFCTGSTGLFYGRVGTGPVYDMYRTTNGGQSWSVVDTSFRFDDITFNDCGFVYCRDSYDFFRSTDGGNTWTQTATDVFGYSTITAEGVGYYGTNDGEIFKSSDYGQTWTRVFYDEDEAFRCIDTSPGGLVVASGMGVLAISRNAGATWNYYMVEGISSAPNTYGRYVKVISETAFFIIGGSGGNSVAGRVNLD